MRLWLLNILWLLVYLLLVSRCKSAELDVDVYRAVGKIYTADLVGGGIRIGTCTIVGRKDETYYALTNKHVTAGQAKGRQVGLLAADRRYDASLIGQSAQVDVAIVSFGAPGRWPVLPMAEREPSEGTPVTCIGYPNNTPYVKESKGTIRDFQITGGRARNLEATAQVLEGMSGGPMVNDEGEIVGLVWGRNRIGNYANAISVADLKQIVPTQICIPYPRSPQQGLSPPTCGPPMRAVPSRPSTRPPVRTVKGDKGDPGDTGPRGPKGDPGRGIARLRIADGQLLVTYTDGTSESAGSVLPPPPDLADYIQGYLDPIYPMWIDNDGNIIDEIPGGVRLGQTMPLRLEGVLLNASGARPE